MPCEIARLVRRAEWAGTDQVEMVLAPDERGRKVPTGPGDPRAGPGHWKGQAVHPQHEH